MSSKATVLEVRKGWLAEDDYEYIATFRDNSFLSERKL